MLKLRELNLIIKEGSLDTLRPNLLDNLRLPNRGMDHLSLYFFDICATLDLQTILEAKIDKVKSIKTIRVFVATLKSEFTHFKTVSSPEFLIRIQESDYWKFKNTVEHGSGVSELVYKGKDGNKMHIVCK